VISGHIFRPEVIQMISFLEGRLLEEVLFARQTGVP
jgi:hypothetical protein